MAGRAWKEEKEGGCGAILSQLKTLDLFVF